MPSSASATDPTLTVLIAYIRSLLEFDAAGHFDEWLHHFGPRKKPPQTLTSLTATYTSYTNLSLPSKPLPHPPPYYSTPLTLSTIYLLPPAIAASLNVLSNYKLHSSPLLPSYLSSLTSALPQPPSPSLKLHLKLPFQYSCCIQKHPYCRYSPSPQISTFLTLTSYSTKPQSKNELKILKYFDYKLNPEQLDAIEEYCKALDLEFNLKNILKTFRSLKPVTTFIPLPPIKASTQIEAIKNGPYALHHQSDADSPSSGLWSSDGSHIKFSNALGSYDDFLFQCSSQSHKIPSYVLKIPLPSTFNFHSIKSNLEAAGVEIPRIRIQNDKLLINCTFPKSRILRGPSPSSGAEVLKEFKNLWKGKWEIRKFLDGIYLCVVFTNRALETFQFFLNSTPSGSDLESTLTVSPPTSISTELINDIKNLSNLNLPILIKNITATSDTTLMVELESNPKYPKNLNGILNIKDAIMLKVIESIEELDSSIDLRGEGEKNHNNNLLL
ncbi:hypothetical protein TL16_g04418 [Triparma laevis f. inornata]|uniref:Uncharacterized protein n=1 Tax=Triparma laevis f. inornata TaxID=1714386 RepID=A0A9W7A924_9STRA|nr:hypothetical protein TL16_g04418 [Triparma laevis f. inornata]